jgi:hypothetical protein
MLYGGYSILLYYNKPFQVTNKSRLDDWSLMEQEGMNSSAADRVAISKEIHVE